jgi:hypothetical protein
MTEPSPSTVVARYECKRPSHAVWLLPGVPLAAILAYRFVRAAGEERLVMIALLAVLLLGVAGAWAVTWLTNVHAVELTAAGTIDFVSRIKRRSFARTALRRVEGQTRRSGGWSPGGSYHASTSKVARFVFLDPGQAETRQEVRLLSQGDVEFQKFIDQLERLDPRLDTSHFRAWDQADS